MSAAPKSRECERFDRWICAYVDEELDAVHCLEVEDHLDGCGDCRDLVTTLRATRVSLRAVCAVKAPASLREKVARSLQVEARPENRAPTPGASKQDDDTTPSELDNRSSLHSGTSVRPPAPLARLRFVVPLAAAAPLALAFGAMRLQEAEEGAATEVAAADGSGVQPIYSAATLDGLLEDLVAQHVHPPPPET